MRTENEQKFIGQSFNFFHDVIDFMNKSIGYVYMDLKVTYNQQGQTSFYILMQKR